MSDIIAQVRKVIGSYGRLRLASLDMGGEKLTGLGDGSASTDAVTKGQLDLKVDKTETQWLQARIDGDGSALAQNALATIRVPFSGTIKNVTLISREASATADIDVLAGDTLAGVESLVSDGTKPGLSSAQTSEKTTFTDWDGVAVTKDDYLQFKVTTAVPVAVKVLDVLVKIERS